MNALKSQYEGRLLRLDRELRELRDSQTHGDSRDEPQDQSAVKVHAGCTFCKATDLRFSHISVISLQYSKPVSMFRWVISPNQQTRDKYL